MHARGAEGAEAMALGAQGVGMVAASPRSEKGVQRNTKRAGYEGCSAMRPDALPAFFDAGPGNLRF